MNNLDLMRLRMRDADQQERMIADKRKTLDKVFLYSYQGADVKKVDDEESHKALINPNALKPDYDDKIISIPFESGFTTARNTLMSSSVLPLTSAKSPNG